MLQYLTVLNSMQYDIYVTYDIPVYLIYRGDELIQQINESCLYLPSSSPRFRALEKS